MKMEKITAYQKGKNFVVKRISDKTELDAEEFLRHLNQAREQLEDMKKGVKKFEKDLKALERLESVANNVREKQLELAREDIKKAGGMR